MNPYSLKDQRLMAAIAHDDASQTRALLKDGSDPNCLGLENETPLIMASQNGRNPEIIKALLADGADPNKQDIAGYTPLMNACRGSYVEITKILLEHGADPNLKVSEDEPGFTALMFACRNGGADIVELLLTHGADASYANRQGETAMDIARERRNKDVILKLFEGRGKISPVELPPSFQTRMPALQ